MLGDTKNPHVGGFLGSLDFNFHERCQTFAVFLKRQWKASGGAVSKGVVFPKLRLDRRFFEKIKEKD